MRQAKKYFLSFEGETELWYFKWLSNEINNFEGSNFNMVLDTKVGIGPLKRVKQLATIGEVCITHIIDRESEDHSHTKGFLDTLSEMKDAMNLGKRIEYKLGYSNFTFELWIVLHKRDCNGELTHRGQYLPLINNAYGESFESLAHYKREDNFKSVLSKMSLDDVIRAIERAKLIMKNNRELGYTLHEHKGFSYYKVNPSLSIWEIVEQILEECGVI